MEEVDTDLELELEIDIEREAMNQRQTWTIIPEILSPEDSSLTFAGVLINGRIKEKHYRRKMKFRNTQLLSHLPAMKIAITAYTDTSLIYSVKMPYEMWMDAAALQIHQVLTSSANKEQLFTVENAGRVKLLPRIPYQVKPAVNYIIPEKTDKLREMEGQAYLDFQVGRSVLLPNFRRNPEELAKIDAIVSTVLNDPDITLTGMTLTGYASPEGTYQSNDRLSKARAEALKTYLKDKFNIRESLFTVDNVPEDWEGLKAMILESQIQDKDRILQIIETVDVFDGRERQIMNLSGGRPYRTMLTEMFPPLRRVEYRAEFTIQHYSLEEAQDIAAQRPENLSLYELFILADSYAPDDPQRDIAFGVMIRQNPDDPVAIINYAAYLLSQNDPNGAKRLLDRVADDPRAANNLGVYYLMQNDLDRASEYFQAVREEGAEQAAHNLQETELKRENNQLMERYKNR